MVKVQKKQYFHFVNIATVYIQKLMLCCCFTQLDFPLKDKLRHTECYLLLTLTENVTFSDLLEKKLGSSKLLFAVRQEFNNLVSGRRLRS